MIVKRNWKHQKSEDALNQKTKEKEEKIAVIISKDREIHRQTKSESALKVELELMESKIKDVKNELGNKDSEAKLRILK